jgi:thiol-disulfide isomerase/thioredoxin
MKLKYLLIFLFLTTIKTGFTQATAYEIQCIFDNNPDTVFYLAHYYGKSTYIDDTARLHQGVIRFDGDSLLASGVYILVNQKKTKVLDFLIDKSQNFTIQSDLKDIIHRTKYVNSPENTTFANYLAYKVDRFSEVEKISRRLTNIPADSDSISILKTKMEKLKNEVIAYENQQIKKDSSSLLSKIILLARDVDMTTISSLTTDQNTLYQYYKNHYWDNVDLSDERLLRTPTFSPKLKQYFDKITYQQVDSIIKSIHLFIPKIKNKEIFKYVVWFLTYEYESSNIMGFDAVYVYMIDEYYAKGKAYWADSTILANVIQKANNLRPVLLGKKAPNLILIDTLENLRSMYEINAEYTLLFFYDPECGHCKKEVKQLKPTLDSLRFDLQVFAVAAKKDKKKWLDFISKYAIDSWINVNGTTSVTRNFRDLYNINSFPEIFILDKEKRIIAKDIRSKQIKDFLLHHKRENSQ